MSIPTEPIDDRKRRASTLLSLSTSPKSLAAAAHAYGIFVTVSLPTNGAMSIR